MAHSGRTCCSHQLNDDMTVEECLDTIYSRARSMNKLSWIENRETHSRIKKTILDVERNFLGMHNIKNLIDRTVQVKVTRTSDDRPYTLPRHGRGTGFLYKRYTSNAKRVCPCPDCMKSPYQKSTHYFIVKTASHVIFDQQEAEKAVFELFYDEKERIGVKLLYGVTVLDSRRHRLETKTCYVVCSTHDDDLADRLSRLCDYSRSFESSPGNTVLVSHPHGVIKKISFGDRTNVHTVVDLNRTYVKLYRGMKISFPYTDDDTEVTYINRNLDKRVIVYDNLSKSYVLSHDLTIFCREGVVVECDSFTLSDREQNDKIWWNVPLAGTQLKTDDGGYYRFPIKNTMMGVFVKKNCFLNEIDKDRYRVYKRLYYNYNNSLCPWSAGAHVDSPSIGYIKSRGLAHFGDYYPFSTMCYVSEPDEEQQHESYEIDEEMECDSIAERREEYDSIIQGPSYKPDDWDHKLPPNVLAITPPLSTSTTTAIKDTPSTSKTATSISTPTTTTTTAETTSAVTATATKRKLRPMIKSRPKVIKLFERTATSAKDEASSSSSATVTTTTTIAAAMSSAASTSTATETLTDEFAEEEKSSNWDFQSEPPAPSSSCGMNVDDNQRSIDADVSAAKPSNSCTSGLALRDYLKDIEKKRAAARKAKNERIGGATGSPSLSASDESSEERREREHRSALEATMSRAVWGIDQGYTNCPLAKRHDELKDVDEVDKILEFEEDKPRLQKIMNRTVRVVVRYTSIDRPDTYVFSKRPYIYIDLRGNSERNRYGTGFLHGSYNNVIKQECPCPGCKSPPNSTQHRTRYHFIVNTATHVIFDKSEAEKALFELQYDSDERGSVKLLYGVTVLGSNQLRLETDYTSVVCVTHDVDLATELKCLCHGDLELTMSWFLVSHPHGKRKKISVNLSPELIPGGVFVLVLNKTEMKLKKDMNIRIVGMIRGDTFVRNYIKSLRDSKILTHDVDPDDDDNDTYELTLNRNVTICNPKGIIIETGREFFDLCEDIEKEMWFRFVTDKLTDDNGYSISNQSNGHSRVCMSVFGNIKSLLDNTDRDKLKIFIMSEYDMASCAGSSGAHVDTNLEHVHFGFNTFLKRGMSSWTYVYNPEESKVDSQANEGGGGGMLNEYRSKLKTLVEKLYPELRSASVKSKFGNSCD